MSYAEAINEALKQEMRRDDRIYVWGEDIRVFYGGGSFGVTKNILQEFGPQRIMDTPISEAGFIGAALGAAMTGLRPVVELMFVDFHGVAWDQIYNQIGKSRYMFGGQAKIPLVVRTTIGGGIRAAAHHSQCLYSLFAHVPGLKVVLPSNPYDAKGLFITAVRDDDPVFIFENKTLYGKKGHVPEEPYTIPFGNANTVKEGSDVTVVATSAMVHKSSEAAEQLAKEGVNVEIIDPRTIVPLDAKTILDSVKKTGRLVIADEDYDRCGFAKEVAALVADEGFDSLDAPIKTVTTPTIPIPFSPPLEDLIHPSAEKIVKTIRSIMS